MKDIPYSLRQIGRFETVRDGRLRFYLSATKRTRHERSSQCSIPSVPLKNGIMLASAEISAERVPGGRTRDSTGSRADGSLKGRLPAVHVSGSVGRTGTVSRFRISDAIFDASARDVFGGDFQARINVSDGNRAFGGATKRSAWRAIRNGGSRDRRTSIPSLFPDFSDAVSGVLKDGPCVGFRAIPG
jgi:hypothetical protein